MVSTLSLSSLWFCLSFVYATSTTMSGLTKQKDYDWKDSNIALLGTDKDRAVKSKPNDFFVYLYQILFVVLITFNIPYLILVNAHSRNRRFVITCFQILIVFKYCLDSIISMLTNASSWCYLLISSFPIFV